MDSRVPVAAVCNLKWRPLPLIFSDRYEIKVLRVSYSMFSTLTWWPLQIISIFKSFPYSKHNALVYIKILNIKYTPSSILSFAHIFLYLVICLLDDKFHLLQTKLFSNFQHYPVKFPRSILFIRGERTVFTYFSEATVNPIRLPDNPGISLSKNHLSPKYP